MKLVDPIRDKEIVADIKEYLKERNQRNYILFLLGVDTGLRISDILQLRVKDVQGWRIEIKEKKTKKEKRIRMTKELKAEIRKYCEDKNKNEFLIKSRKGKNQPISRAMAYIMLKQVADEFCLDNIGCHSLRKTFGYMFYMQFKDVAALQEIFNHSDPKITLRYIGINQENLDNMMSKFKSS
jgi:integrase